MNSEQIRALKGLDKRKNYDGSPSHAKQVMRLSIRIHKELARVGMLPKSKNEKAILRSAALLHNVGLPEEPHNKTGFDILSVEIPRALSIIPLAPKELSTILYCALASRRNLQPERNIEIKDQPHVRKLAAILRIADGLDRSLMQVVENVSLSLANGRLVFSISSKRPADAEIKRTDEKTTL
jgi:exopolyphosphatase / guanosine-5'-triphosphate,3'-diphosphate pyrophosphatase